jgi:hypothetical protein
MISWRSTITLLLRPEPNGPWTMPDGSSRPAWGWPTFRFVAPPATISARGVRVMAFRRRVLIAYAVAGQEVTILRILYGGRRFADEDTAPP